MSNEKIVTIKTDETRIGEHAALQPLSGVKQVTAAFAVNGLGSGGFGRSEETQKKSA